MLTASLGYTGRKNRRRHGETFDVGDGRRMTARQIALATGLNVSAIYGRLEKGDRGAQLFRPARRKAYDCGGGLMLTVKEIQARTGISEASVRSRISRGVTGAALLRKERRDAAAPRSSTVVVACRIADMYPDRLPTTKEIRALYPMSAQSAARWLTAFRVARARA